MTLSPKKVLIVEDDKDFLWILRQALDGEEGVAIAEKEKPDLIIMDIMMPKMDGITAAKAIRAKGVTGKIIFLTNLKDPVRVSQAMEADEGTDYIVKSDVHVDAILQRIKDKLGL
jgi:DNA-binding NarL/FixJ family response regulator